MVSTALCLHSHYSMLDGATPLPELCRRARLAGYTAIALTDINNLYGLWAYLSSCAEYGLTPIIGAEIRTSSYRLFCLVKDEQGYGNLCQLLSRVHHNKELDLHHELATLGKGLLVLATTVEQLHIARSVGCDVFAALCLRANQDNHRLRSAARTMQIRAVAVCDAYFGSPEEYPAHKLLRAIRYNLTLSTMDGTAHASPDAWLPSPAELTRRFEQWPDALDNIAYVREKCSFTTPGRRLVMPPCKQTGDADAQLRSAAFEGACKRYGTPLPQAVRERLNHELTIIGEMGFSSYFLVVQEIVGPVARTCGRGSGAASLVAYCLFITNVCPVKHNLYFERFLNPGRTDPPDIDVDFPWDERDAILHRVLQEHGQHAAMVCNHVMLQPRMAIRETAKVFGLPDGEISRVTRKLPWQWRAKHKQTGFLNHLQSLPQMRGISLTAPWPEILTLAEKISGAPRNLSVHPGGVIITPEPINRYVPVEPAPKGVPIIQWEKDGAEEAGLVKIDLLGNRSLGVIRDAIHSIRSQDIPFAEERWEPEDDLKTQQLIARGETMGCFYIESPATRLLQKRAATGDFNHLVIHSSIIRPAANEFIREYLRRLHGGTWEPLHPLVGNVLDESYGIMVYQEDVSRVAVQFGFSHSQADQLRKIMSKKDKRKKLADFKQRFFQQANKRNVTRKTAERIWQMMMSFDGYSFCKPHSASYAKVSFQAAYLKIHFPAEFMAAVLSNCGGYYSTFAYVSEAKRLGLTLLPPDVNTSRITWEGARGQLRVGLMAIQQLSTRTMHTILREREKKPFSSPMDFFSRVTPGQDEALNLIHCGALDQVDQGRNRLNRAALCWQLARWHKQRDTQNGRLFTLPDKGPALPPGNPLDQLRKEFSVLGFLCSCHPIELFDRYRKKHRTVLAKDINRYAGDAPSFHGRRKIRFLGWLITGKIVGTKHGEPMEFLSFEDETGMVECTFFPKVYDRYCDLLHHKGPLLLEGFVEQEFGAWTFTVERAAGKRTGFEL